MGEDGRGRRERGEVKSAKGMGSNESNGRIENTVRVQ